MSDAEPFETMNRQLQNHTDMLIARIRGVKAVETRSSSDDVGLNVIAPNDGACSVVGSKSGLDHALPRSAPHLRLVSYVPRSR